MVMAGALTWSLFVQPPTEALVTRLVTAVFTLLLYSSTSFELLQKILLL